jgi:hypothetical protein
MIETAGRAHAKCTGRPGRFSRAISKRLEKGDMAQLA